MKKFWILMVLAAFLMAAPVAQVAFAKEAAKVNCCVKGKCSQVTKADCKKAKGKVVKNCKSCK